MRRNPGKVLPLPANSFSSMKNSYLRLFCSTLLLLTLSVSSLFGQRKHVDPDLQNQVPSPLAVENYPCPGTPTFTEDFELGLPAGWSVLDVDGLTPRSQTGLNPGWQVIQDYKDTANTAMASPSWYSLPDTSNDWLIMDQMTLGNQTCISWLGYSADGFFPESYELRISTTTNDTTGFLAEPVVMTVAAESGEKTYHSANLSDYAGQTVYLAFRQTSFNNFILVLDDIQTTEYATSLDAGVDSLTTITPQASVAWQFSGAVRNYGTDTITAFDLAYSIDNGPIMVEVFDSIILPPNHGFFFLHDSLFTSATTGTYDLCMWSENPNLSVDDDINNDSLCTTFTVTPFVGIEPALDFDEYFRVWPNPAGSTVKIDTRLPQPADWQLSLMSMEGREVFTSQMSPTGPTELDIAHLPAGMYVLKGTSAEGQWHRKIVKQ